MKKLPATWTPADAASDQPDAASGRAILRTSLIAGLVLTLMACSSRPPQTGTEQADSMQPSSANDTLAACAPSQLAFTLDPGEGRFNGMSHSGTMLELRNAGAAACTIPAHPVLSFADSNKQTLNITAQASTEPDSTSNSQITFAPGATVTSDLRWVSGDVYDNGHCESPTRISLSIGQQTISAAFAGHLCGAGGKPSTYTLASFKPAAASAPAMAAKPMAYTCNDGRTVQAAYPDTDTATLILDGQTHRLHAAISASGTRYVSDHWQWWTKGMHQAWLAPLKLGETIASAAGTACIAP